ncbi:DUF998 domain-containing protein [Brevibacterium sediminis]|uniref:DUF998 domain-containing protein n=2 Tax=Brevibacterium sediminis TaxID=1857024 RepID=A0A5C4X6K1_9MICO|nr:DUF998 domain-containing protein [Brevibacterium sediminis]
MLGWGVVAGPFYLVFGLILALARDGFDLTRHSLSLLSLGEGGWLQILNFALTGAALSASPIGVGLLWLAVVAGFAWLLVSCLWVYRVVPHPDLSRR